MKKLLLAALVALVIAPAVNAQDDAQAKRYNMYGVMFYNLENLFDTINSNGTYDLEFSPSGARQWDGRKYWSKINRMAYAISQMKTSNTPMGPAIIGVSEDGRVVYDYNLMIEALMLSDNMTYDEASEFIDYNTIRALPYMGEKAPIVMYSKED